MASSSAVLSVWDTVRLEPADIEITWKKGHDEDAKVMVPVRYKKDWQLATTALKADYEDAGEFHPLKNLPYSVPVENLNRSAWGAYVIAGEIFGPVGRGWREPPPYPEAQEEDEFPEGAKQ